MFRNLAKLVIQAQQRLRMIDISDEYINWLCFVNPGMLHRGNLYSFDHAICNVPGQLPIVEIGSFCGLSTNILTYFKQRHGKSNRLLTCDRWDFEGAGPAEETFHKLVSITHAEYRSFVKETYLRCIQMFSRDDLPFTIEASSDEFFRAWEAEQKVVDVLARPVQLGGPIGFAYIDGNHSYEFARRDFLSCDKFLASGGFLLFDDSADFSGWGVSRLARELRHDKRYELVIKNPNCLFQKR